MVSHTLDINIYSNNELSTIYSGRGRGPPVAKRQRSRSSDDGDSGNDVRRRSRKHYTVFITSRPAGFTTNTCPLRVATVRPGSLAEKAGINEGDHILYLNDQKVDSLSWSDTYWQADLPLTLTLSVENDEPQMTRKISTRSCPD